MNEDVARLLEIIQEAKEIVMRVEEQLEKIQCEQKLRKYDNILIGDLKLHSNETRILTCLCHLFDCNWYEVKHKTVADIIEYKPTDLLKVRNFGKGMLDALQTALRIEGVVWK